MNPCTVPGCPDERAPGRSLCGPHRRYRQRHGTLDGFDARRPRSDWAPTDKSYRFVRDATGRTRREHVLVMERTIGRQLLPHETVHHRNGQRRDNRPENLELWSSMQPKGQRVSDKVTFALEILALYGDTATARQV